MRQRLAFAAIVCAFGAAMAVTFTTRLDGAALQQPAPDPTITIDVGRSPTKGSKSAKVAIIEYADFQCPHCGAFFRDTLPALDARHVKTGRVLLVFKHRPIPKLHPDAVMAATGAECAGEQGSFWPMHDLLFREQQNLSRASLVQRAARLALNPESFIACLDIESRRVKDDMAAATALQITGTPTFLVGTLQAGRIHVRERLEGALPIAAFQQVVDRLLAEPR